MYRTIIARLKEWRQRKDRMPLILKGARQIGKTYILQKFGEENFKTVHYFNFERRKNLLDFFEKDLDPKRIVKDLSTFIDQKIDIENDLLIFDEIQECSNALTSLKYFQEEIPKLAITAAGSLLGLKLNNASFPVGKVEYLNMYPMTFEEFLLALNKNSLCELISGLKISDSIPEPIHEQLWDLLKIYFIIGGLPKAVETFVQNQEDFDLALRLTREKQDDLINTYSADMAKHSGKENSMHLERLWSNIPLQLSREQDGSTSKFKFKGVIPEKSKYSRLVGCIDWLMAAGLILKVPIIDSIQIPLKSCVIENRFKLFIFDVGILAALSDISPNTILQYNYGTYKGYFAENFVAQEFVASEGRVDRLFAWKQNTSEIEFIRDIYGNILPVEVKSGERTRSKSLKIFADKYKPRHRVFMSAQNLSTDKTGEILKYPLYLAGKFPLDLMQKLS